MNAIRDCLQAMALHIVRMTALYVEAFGATWGSSEATQANERLIHLLLEADDEALLREVDNRQPEWVDALEAAEAAAGALYIAIAEAREAARREAWIAAVQAELDRLMEAA